MTKEKNTGKLRIGDAWNAITIIALSQNNPLKAIAEFVENSIDAKAKNIIIIRGKEKGEVYLKIIDDGTGIPKDKEGIPDFKYVATHICDSIKRRLKTDGVEGIQGEFGIGLLSFWTVGEKLLLSCSGDDGRMYQMEMSKNEQGYNITKKRTLFSQTGTELVIYPLLPGLRQLNGEKIQNYLASELRDRIKKSVVNIVIKDRYSRKEFIVKPRQFTGRLIHEIDPVVTKKGEIYIELYLNTFDTENKISLYRHGTRVMPDISKLDSFNTSPWDSSLFQGMIDVPFLQLTPGTRDGIIRDENYSLFCSTVSELEKTLNSIVEREKKAAEEEASKNILRSIKKALKEALLRLPQEEYDWFNLFAEKKRIQPGKENTNKERENISKKENINIIEHTDDEKEDEIQKQFFDYPGPLYSAMISPSSCITMVDTKKILRVIPRDKKRKIVDRDLEISWSIKEGDGKIDKPENEIINFEAPSEPGITIIEVKVQQNDIICSAEGIVTVTDTLIEKNIKDRSSSSKGLPGYTFKRAPGELWRSVFDEKNNIVIINNGHSDFIFAMKKKSLKLKYICRLYTKELVLKNFKGFSAPELLERMVELSLYTEEFLK